MSPLESINSSVNSCNSSNDIFKPLKLFASFTVGCPPSTKTANEFCNKSINNLLSSFPVFHRGISIESQSDMNWHRDAILEEALTSSPIKFFPT